jgi:putative transposase
LYHIVCPSKYRRKVFSKTIEKTLKETYEGISQIYEIKFIEMGSDEDPVHFFVQSVPTYFSQIQIYMNYLFSLV